jgi:hypothetical protein
MSTFRAEYIEEPDLVFGYGEEKDPRIGLKHWGPYFYPQESGPTPTSVRIGIIGDSSTITETRLLIEAMRSPITSASSNKWLYPDFPGFNMGTKIKCDLVLSDNWNAILKENEIKRTISIDNPNQRIRAAVELYNEAVQQIAAGDDKPNVIVCALPQPIEDRCGISTWTRAAKTKDANEIEEIAAELAKTNQQTLEEWGFEFEERSPASPESARDLHNALKGRVMSSHIPIQVLRYSTLRGFFEPGEHRRDTQEPATIAWNFGTALYYKANGKPWRLAKLRTDTCYVGIAFFQNLLSPIRDVQTSMAQVFTHNGEGIVLRGKDVVKDSLTREYHLTSNEAYELMVDALKKYQSKANRDPSRVVVHKTTQFSKDEISGFDKAVGSRARVYVTVSRDNDIRYLRTGKYPVLRGTMIDLGQGLCLLYTSGYTPRLRTYPGPRIPDPLLVRKSGDSELSEVCKEIMGLTKLNWNTTAFGTAMPITLQFARSVGKVLSELEQEEPPESDYRFYM